jgi:tetratricopeptide (TPR) repeat protein
MMDAQLFGVWAGGHHLMAVSLHSISVSLLFLFLYRATGAIGRSAFVAAVYAIHPMRVESVAWVAERKDILPALMLMIALNAYVSYVRRPSVLRYLGVTVPFVIGMLAKPILIPFPFALLLVDLWPLRRVESSWRAVRQSAGALIVEKLPWMALSIGIVILNIAIQVQPLSTLEGLPLTQRLANVLIHYTEYLAMMIWPSRLSPLHPVAMVMPAWWMLGGAIVALAGLSILAIRAFPTRPYVMTGWFWFLAALVPVIGFVQAGDQGMADRFGYNSQFFLYAIAAWGAVDLAGRIGASRPVLAAAAVIVILGCAVTTRSYLWNWHDGISLWRYTVANDPDNHHAQANLADALAVARRYPESYASYREAIRLAPGFPEYHYYFGTTLAKSGRTSEAISEFDAMLKAKPDDAQTHDALGLALAVSGRVDEAIEHLQRAIRLDPHSSSAQANLGVALARKGDANGALAAYDQALKMDPSQAQVHSNRAALLLATNKVDQAIAGFREAQRLEPYSPERLVNLGGALSHQNRLDEANTAFDRALAIDPNYAEAYNGRGVLLSGQDKNAEAIAAFTKALEINPGLVHVYSNRGRAFAVSGNIDAAIRDFQQILRLDPGNASAAGALAALTKIKK